MKVAVTGGNGFIGRRLAERLKREGHEVKVIDIERGKDVRNLKMLDEELSDVDLVYHLAAVVSVERCRDDPLTCVQTNINGTLNIMELAYQYGYKVIYASSAAVYGEPLYIPIDELHPTRPKNLYGATKLSGEGIVLSYAQERGVRACALRLFNVYGPGMGGGPYAGVIYTFIRRTLEGKPLIIYGDGRQVRDFVYVDDVIEAFLKAQHLPSDSYNVGTGKGVSVLRLAEIIQELVGRKVGLAFAPPRPGDIRVSIASIEKIKSLSNWRPKVELLEGLKRTIGYVRRSMYSDALS